MGHKSLFINCQDFQVFRSFHKITDLTFLPKLYIRTNDSILSYAKMMSYAKNLVPDIFGQHLNNSEWHKYQISMHTNYFSKC